MDIIIKTFQTYYKLPELMSTECDWVKWTKNIETGSSENLMCAYSSLEENSRKVLLETNQSFKNLITSIVKFHFKQNTIKNFNHVVEYEDAYELIADLAKNGELNDLFDFKIYDFWGISFVYPEVIYITQLIDYIFKTLQGVFKALNKASIKSYNILESRKPTELIHKKDIIQEKYNQISGIIDKAIANKEKSDTINKLINEQKTLKESITNLENEIINKEITNIQNRIDKNLVLGDKFMNGFVYNMDIVTYLIFINSDVIPSEMIPDLNKQLKISNTNFLTFILNKCPQLIRHSIKHYEICYLKKQDIQEFDQKIKKQTFKIDLEQITTLLRSKTVSPTHKFEALFTNYISLSDPLGQSILFGIIQKLGFGNRLSF